MPFLWMALLDTCFSHRTLKIASSIPSFFLWAEGIQSSKITGINAGHPFSGYSQQVKAVCVQHNGRNVLGVNRIKSVTEHPRGAKGIFNGL